MVGVWCAFYCLTKSNSDVCMFMVVWAVDIVYGCEIGLFLMELPL